MSWRFTVFDETFHQSDLKLGQARRVEDLMSYVDVKGVAVRPNWGEIHPLRSANAACAIAAVMYGDRIGMDAREALKKVEAEIGTDTFIEEVDPNASDDLPTVLENGFPPSADEPSTTS